MVKRIGVLTAGGDAPGLNVCLKAVVYGAIDQGYDVIGIRKGWYGLIHYDPQNPDTHAANAMIVTKPRIRDIDRMRGSYLHSSRLEPHQIIPEMVPPFLQEQKQAGQASSVDLTDHVMRVLEKLDLEALVVMGDNDALNYAARLSSQGVPLIGIPKTVHNDVSGSDYSLGFSTALGRGVQFVYEMQAMAGSREEIAIIEILGRSTGLVTLLTSLLAGSDRTLIPEVPFDPDALLELLLNDQKLNPNNYAVLLMSEASRIIPEKASSYAPQLLEDKLGDRVSGTGAEITEVLENMTGQRFLFQPLSLLIRTAIADGQDLLGAMNFAAMTVNLLAAGKTGRLVAYRQLENYVDLPIETVTQPGGNINVANYYDAKNYRPRRDILWASRI
jgi:6-phosphofructokinase